MCLDPCSLAVGSIDNVVCIISGHCLSFPIQVPVVHHCLQLSGNIVIVMIACGVSAYVRMYKSIGGMNILNAYAGLELCLPRVNFTVIMATPSAIVKTNNTQADLHTSVFGN